jgi:type IV pilus assembly protein PilP
MMSSALILPLLLAACDLFISGEGDPAGAAPLAPVAPTKAADADEEDKKPAYSYSPLGKRDPFRSFIEMKVETAEVCCTQKYDIDQYHLVGIIWGVDRPRALVEDPENVGWVIEIGSYLGKNWGKVTSINANEVVVTEEYQTIDGELVVNNLSIKLPIVETEELR